MQDNKATTTGTEEATTTGTETPQPEAPETPAQEQPSENTELEALAAELAEDVPEEYRALIPNLPPMERVRWIRKATKDGLFTKPQPDGPGAQRPASKKSENLDGLTPYEMMLRGYSWKN